MTGREGEEPRRLFCLFFLPMLPWGSFSDRKIFWHRDAFLANPLVRWITGARGREVGVEDLVACVAWGAVLLFTTWIGYRVRRFNLLEAWWLFLFAAMLPLVSAVGTAAHQVAHVRSLSGKLDLEQLLLTAVTPLELAQGLHARPLAVHRCGATVSFIGFGAVVAVGLAPLHDPWPWLVMSALAIGLLYLANVTSLTCGCVLGLRECLLRGPVGAFARAGAIWVGRFVGSLFLLLIPFLAVSLMVAAANRSLRWEMVGKFILGGLAFTLPVLMIVMPLSTHGWSKRLRSEIADSAQDWQLFESVPNPDALPRRAWRWWWRWLRGGR